MCPDIGRKHTEMFMGGVVTLYSRAGLFLLEVHAGVLSPKQGARSFVTKGPHAQCKEYAVSRVYCVGYDEVTHP